MILIEIKLCLIIHCHLLLVEHAVHIHGAASQHHSDLFVVIGENYFTFLVTLLSLFIPLLLFYFFAPNLDLDLLE